VIVGRKAVSDQRLAGSRGVTVKAHWDDARSLAAQASTSSLVFEAMISFSKIP